MPLGKNKVKVNIYLTRDQHKAISDWAKDNGVSISSLYCTFTDDFLKHENNGENSWILVNKNDKNKVQHLNKVNKKDELEIIKNNLNNDEFKILMYNLENSCHMNGF